MFVLMFTCSASFAQERAQPDGGPITQEEYARAEAELAQAAQEGRITGEELREKLAALKKKTAQSKDFDPVSVIFLYQVIELTGEIADMAERVGRRLELLLSH